MSDPETRERRQRRRDQISEASNQRDFENRRDMIAMAKANRRFAKLGKKRARREREREQEYYETPLREAS